MIIGLCITIMLVISFVGILAGNGFVSYADSTGVSSTVLVNGTGTSFNVGDTAVLFEVDAVLGAIGIIVVLATIVALIGVQVLATGLSDASVRTLRTAIIYAGLWGILSAGASALIISIETFGLFIYIAISLLYVIGILQKLGGNG